MIRAPPPPRSVTPSEVPKQQVPSGTAARSLLPLPQFPETYSPVARMLLLRHLSYALIYVFYIADFLAWLGYRFREKGKPRKAGKKNISLIFSPGLIAECLIHQQSIRPKLSHAMISDETIPAASLKTSPCLKSPSPSPSALLPAPLCQPHPLPFPSPEKQNTGLVTLLGRQP